jgi:hypothetical protein
VELANSIARGGPAPDLLARRGGAITASFSSFTTAVDSGGTVPSPGSGSNVSGDPQFTAPLTVGGLPADDAGSYSLRPSSPLIDRGDASLVAAGETDLAGAPRSLDGDGDCVARPDIGAFERPSAACNPRPVVSRFRATHRVFAPAPKRKRASAGRRRVRRGTTFLFRLSEAAKFRIKIERVRGGRRVKGRCLKPRRRYRHKRRCRRYRKVGTIKGAARKGGNRKRFSGRIKGRALRRGRYRATIVATDAEGAKSKPRRLRLRIARR